MHDYTLPDSETTMVTYERIEHPLVKGHKVAQIKPEEGLVVKLQSASFERVKNLPYTLPKLGSLKIRTMPMLCLRKSCKQNKINGYIGIGKCDF